MRNSLPKMRRYCQALPRLWVIAFTQLIWLTGCGTPGVSGHLWSANWATFSEPAPEPHLAVMKQSARGDFLVEYDELPASADKTIRRSYLLLANDSKVESGRKPAFEKQPASQEGDRFPVYQQSEEMGLHLTNSYVRFKPYTRSLEIIDGGGSLGQHSLPVYQVTSGVPTKVLLTPFAVAADLTVVGFFVGVYCLPHSYYY